MVGEKIKIFHQVLTKITSLLSKIEKIWDVFQKILTKKVFSKIEKKNFFSEILIKITPFFPKWPIAVNILFLEWKSYILIKISLASVLKGPIVNESALFQLMACCQTGDKHYLNQWWPCSVMPYSVTRGQGLKQLWWNRPVSQ